MNDDLEDFDMRYKTNSEALIGFACAFVGIVAYAALFAAVAVWLSS